MRRLFVLAVRSGEPDGARRSDALQAMDSVADRFPVPVGVPRRLVVVGVPDARAACSSKSKIADATSSTGCPVSPARMLRVRADSGRRGSRVLRRTAK